MTVILVTQDKDKGLNIDWDQEQGLMNIVEAQYIMASRGKLSAGTLRFGTWYHSAECSIIESDQFETVNGNFGMYLSLDQPLTENVTAFYQGGFARSDRSDVPIYSGFGVKLVPFQTKQPDDVIGLGIAAAKINTSNNWEVSFEATWSMQLTEWFTVKPDFQYVINPGGDPARNPVLQVGLRTEISI